MNNVTTKFEMAQLAEAAYAELGQRRPSKDELISLLQINGFSKNQAELFVEKWAVADFQANTTSGFSAALYQRLDENKNKTGVKTRGQV